MVACINNEFASLGGRYMEPSYRMGYIVYSNIENMVLRDRVIDNRLYRKRFPWGTGILEYWNIGIMGLAE